RIRCSAATEPGSAFVGLAAVRARPRPWSVYLAPVGRGPLFGVDLRDHGVIAGDDDDALAVRVDVVSDDDVLPVNLAYPPEFLAGKVHGGAAAEIGALAHKRNALLREPVPFSLLRALVDLPKEIHVLTRADVPRHQNDPRLQCPEHHNPGS